ncbi:MAG: class II fumarate hydratase [Pseudomonadota bacterium]
MNRFRIEQDSIGEVKVPSTALWGAQTQRAVDNFTISAERMPRDFIRALGLIKAAAAEVNNAAGLLDRRRATAIRSAAQEVAAGSHDAQFPIAVLQTGSGTSSNMNANEVIATLASRRGGLAVHPNDHVNCSQSSNDVIPTAIHISAALSLKEKLLPSLMHLRSTIEKKSRSLRSIVKTGRTHLMDAMPLTLGQELSGWAEQTAQGIRRIQGTQPRLVRLAQGGTAVGTGINAPARFGVLFAKSISKSTGIKFQASSNYFESLSCQDTALELSGQLRVLAVSLLKISNDMRWMNSGPLAGLGEIELPALQPGSSIMPGKVNPVIPESVAMACAQVIGNDAAIAVAAQFGNFQLNTMLPLIAARLLESIHLLANASVALADKAIAGFKPRPGNLQQALARNPILITALNGVIGYEAAAAIAKQAYREGRPILDVARERTKLDIKTLRKLLDPARLTRGGVTKRG